MMTHRLRMTLAICLTMILTLGLETAGAQDNLPYSPDDLKFGEVLAGRYPELALVLFKRVESSPEVPEEVRLKAGMMLLDAYRELAAEVPDPVEREKYLKLATAQVEALVAKFQGKALPPDLVYEQALLLQTQGRSAAASLPRLTDQKEREAVINRSNQYFEEAIPLFVQVQQVAMQRRKELETDKAANKDAIQKMLELQLKGALKLGWTLRYQGVMYPEGSEEHKHKLERATAIFDAFITQYPTDMSVLSAYYARALCKRDLGKPDEAMEDFNTIVVGTVGIPDVADLRMQCATLWAELATRQGKFDEALKMLDDELAADETIAGGETVEAALMQKAKTLSAKGDTLKGTDNAAAIKAYRDSVALLRSVVTGGGHSSAEAGRLMVETIDKAGLGLQLEPVERLVLAENLVRESKFAEAANVLEAIVNAEGTIDGQPLGLRIRHELGRVYRYAGEYEKSLKALDELIRMFPDQTQMVEVALDRCKTLAGLAQQSRKPETDELYLQSLKDLAEKYSQTPEGRDGWYYYGEALRKRSRYVQAAEAYDNVQPEAEKYWQARFAAGLSYYEAYQSLARKRRVGTEEAVGYFKKAEQRLIEVISKGKPRADEDWHLKAAVILADLYDGTARYEDVLKAVDMFAARYPNEANGNSDLVYRKMRAYSSLGRLSEAETEVKKLEAGEAENPEALLGAYLTLADGYMKKSELQRQDNKIAEAAAGEKKAAEFLKKAMQFVKPEAGDVWGWLAGRFFKLNDTENALIAAGNAEKAYGASDDRVWSLRLLRLKCMKILGRWDADALKLLQDLDQHYPNSAEIKMELAAYLMHDKQWSQALDILQRVAKGLQGGTDMYFDAQYRKAACYVELSDMERAREIINLVRGLYPDMGGPEMKARFDTLERRVP